MFKLEDFLPFRLSVLSQTVSGAIARQYAEKFGLSMNEWRCMVIIYDEGQTTAREICEISLLDKMTISRAIKLLGGKGFIKQTTNNQDGRAKTLCLTQQGKTICENIIPLAQTYEASLLSSLSKNELNSFNKTLEKIYQRAQTIKNRE